MGSIYIRTFTGKKFYLDSPRPEMVCIEDVAHALSHLCRFTGHTREFYSVAQHSVYVAEILSNWREPEEVIRAGLLHDAPEAYYGDLSSPLKILLGEAYRAIRGPIDEAVNLALNLPPHSENLWTHVKEADNHALMVEGKAIVTGFGSTLQDLYDRKQSTRKVPSLEAPMSPEKARERFMNWWESLR